MTYCLVGDKQDASGPTIQGMRLLRESVLASGGKYPLLTEFVNTGETDSPQKMAIEIIKYEREISDLNLLSTLNSLRAVAASNRERLTLCM